MIEDEREKAKRFMIDAGHVIHNAALIMLVEARQKGLSSYIAEVAISHAAMLVAAQMFNGRREQFVESAAAAFGYSEGHVHEGTGTRQ
jgi:hypothetical protein